MSVVTELDGDPVWFNNPSPASSPSFWDSLVSGHQLYREIFEAEQNETISVGLSQLLAGSE